MCIECPGAPAILDGALLQDDNASVWAIAMPHLTMAEALRVECTCLEIKQIVQLHDSWVACVRREVSGFSLPEQPLRSDISRRDFKKVVAALVRVGIAGLGPVVLPGLKEAKALEAAIHRMEQKVAKYAAQGGRETKVMVGVFSFVSGPPILDSYVQPTLQPMMACKRILRLDDSAKPETWKICLGWQTGAGLYCRAEPVGVIAAPNFPEETPAILIDIQAVSSDFVLRVEDMRLEAGGPWARNRCGLCAALGTQAAAVEALTRGLTCVLFVRAGGEVQQVSPSEILLLNALHLDMRGTRYTD